MKPSASTADVLIVGSGMNSLVAAALLARRGRSVLVLEREKVLGGCIRTEELTLPGFLHDTLSMAQPAFVSGPAYALLGQALQEAGLRYCRNDTPTGVLLPDGRSLVLSTSRETNRSAFERACAGDGTAYARAMDDVDKHAPLIFSLLGNDLWSLSTAKDMVRQVWKHGAHPIAGYLGSAMASCRSWLETSIQGEALRALLAPWALHSGLGPDSSLSALMTQVICLSLENVGMPIPVGGNARTVDAFVRVISQAGGRLETQADVKRILVRQGKAYGVTLSGGREIHAGHVICNVTPTQLYGDLIEDQHVPPPLREQARNYRYGKGNMQIHVALAKPLRWPSEELAGVSYVHLTAGPDSISKAVNEAERGLLPAHPTICVGQPCAMDPGRAPAGRSILWIQLPECPRIIRGDAAGLIGIPPDGSWSEAVREAYADRVMEQLALYVPDLKDSVLARRVLSPADIAAANVNLVGGDPYGGACDLDQSMLWRPLRGTRNHETPIRNLWHIGASTHPGPGLGGVSGMLIAQRLGAC